MTNQETEVNTFKPDWNTEAVLVEEMQRMAKRIEELEAERESAQQEPFGYFQYDIRLDAWVQNRVNSKGVAFYIKEKA